jgi:hypothetical protein
LITTELFARNFMVSRPRVRGDCELVGIDGVTEGDGLGDRVSDGGGTVVELPVVAIGVLVEVDCDAGGDAGSRFCVHAEYRLAATTAAPAPVAIHPASRHLRT